MAYYSNQGEKIFSGAAGLGNYGPLRSYRDGSLGHHNSQLEAYRDGSLGVMATMKGGYCTEQRRLWKAAERLGEKFEMPQECLYRANLRYEEEPEYVMIPPPKRPQPSRLSTMYSSYSRGYGPVRGTTTMAIDNGVLGGYGPLQSFQDGSLGGYGLLQAYQDGSLGADNPSGIGEYFTGTAGVGEYFTGTAGVGEYFTGTAGCGSCGLGQAASGVLLNLSDPATLLEVKSLIAYSPLLVGNVGLPETQADLASTQWTAHTTALVDQLLMLSAMQLQAQWDSNPESLPKHEDGTSMTKDEATAALAADLNKAFPAPERYPTYDGIMLLRSLLGNAPINVPIVDEYIKAGGGPVGEPNKTSPAKEANFVGIGVGVGVAVLLGVLLFGGKKRRA